MFRSRDSREESAGISSWLFDVARRAAMLDLSNGRTRGQTRNTLGYRHGMFADVTVLVRRCLHFKTMLTEDTTQERIGDDRLRKEANGHLIDKELSVDTVNREPVRQVLAIVPTVVGISASLLPTGIDHAFRSCHFPMADYKLVQTSIGVLRQELTDRPMNYKMVLSWTVDATFR